MSFKEAIKKMSSSVVWGNCLGLLLASLVFLLGIVWFMHFYTRHGQTVKIPNVVGKNVRIVEEQFEDMGIDVVIVDTGYIRPLPPDIILHQGLKAGSIVKPGRHMFVTINAAHAMAVAMPDIADNSSVRAAEAKLRALGFKLTAPKYTPGDRDWVYGVEAGGKPCKAGDRIYVDTPITLVVGDGHIFEEYTGNDSIDYEVNSDFYYGGDSIIDESVE